MPAFGFDAVPLPMKKPMKSVIGLDAVTELIADALGETTAPTVVDAAGLAVALLPSNSRREEAATVHTNGATAGSLPPSPPEPSHDSTPAATPKELARTAAAGAGVGGVAVRIGGESGVSVVAAGSAGGALGSVESLVTSGTGTPSTGRDSGCDAPRLTEIESG